MVTVRNGGVKAGDEAKRDVGFRSWKLIQIFGLMCLTVTNNTEEYALMVNKVL